MLRTKEILQIIRRSVTTEASVFPNLSLFLKNKTTGLPIRESTNAKPMYRINAWISNRNQNNNMIPTKTLSAFKIPKAIAFAVFFTS